MPGKRELESDEDQPAPQRQRSLRQQPSSDSDVYDEDPSASSSSEEEEEEVDLSSEECSPDRKKPTRKSSRRAVRKQPESDLESAEDPDSESEEELLLSSGEEEPDAEKTAKMYVCEDDETPMQIAKKHDIDAKQLVSFNKHFVAGLTMRSRLMEGTRLYLSEQDALRSVVHEGFACDECAQDPICGARYTRKVISSCEETGTRLTALPPGPTQL